MLPDFLKAYQVFQLLVSFIQNHDVFFYTHLILICTFNSDKRISFGVLVKSCLPISRSKSRSRRCQVQLPF